MSDTIRPNLINRVFVDENDEFTYKIIDVIDDRETVTVVRVDPLTFAPALEDEWGWAREQPDEYEFDLDLALDLLDEYKRRQQEHIAAARENALDMILREIISDPERVSMAIKDYQDHFPRSFMSLSIEDLSCEIIAYNS
jgi:type I site-specific restriction-modification system R (restriction) subunit